MSVFTLLSLELFSALDEKALVCEICVENSDGFVPELRDPSTGDSRDLRSGVSLLVIDDLESVTMQKVL